MAEKSSQLEYTGTVALEVVKAITRFFFAPVSRCSQSQGDRTKANARKEASTRGCPPFQRRKSFAFGFTALLMARTDHSRYCFLNATSSFDPPSNCSQGAIPLRVLPNASR